MARKQAFFTPLAAPKGGGRALVSLPFAVGEGEGCFKAFAFPNSPA